MTGNQDQRQINQVVERRHRTVNKSGRMRQTKKTEFGGDRTSDGRVPEVFSAV